MCRTWAGGQADYGQPGEVEPGGRVGEVTNLLPTGANCASSARGRFAGKLSDNRKPASGPHLWQHGAWRGHIWEASRENPGLLERKGLRFNESGASRLQGVARCGRATLLTAKRNAKSN